MKVPAIQPMNTLHFASPMIRFSSVPLRILGSELTSETATFIATFAGLPITESKVKTAPIFTTAGLWQSTEPWKITHTHKASGRATTCLMVELYEPTPKFFTRKIQGPESNWVYNTFLWQSTPELNWRINLRYKKKKQRNPMNLTLQPLNWRNPTNFSGLKLRKCGSSTGTLLFQRLQRRTLKKKDMWSWYLLVL